MSLFDDPNYRWRDTFLVLFDDEQRPTIDLALSAIQQIGKFEVRNSQNNDQDLSRMILRFCSEGDSGYSFHSNLKNDNVMFMLTGKHFVQKILNMKFQKTL